MASSCRGRFPRARPSIRTCAGWRSTSRTTRSSISTSRASSPRSSTARATSSSGTGAPGRRRRRPLDATTAIPAGELKFELHGQKVSGRFTIVRTSGRRRKGDDPAARAFEDDEGDQWLLIHKRGPDAQKGWDAEDYPQSVKTGRTNDDVKADRDAVWISQAPAAAAEIDLTGAVEAPLPQRIEPMLATLAAKPFSDPKWLFEIKWDGYRVQAVVADGAVRIWTRNLHDAETYFPRLLTPPSWIDARQAIVDGEVVALDEAGRPDFGLLQERLGAKGSPGLVFQAFDLLYHDGRSLLDVALEDRKRLLKSVLRPHPRVRFAAHVEAEGETFHEAAAAQGLEGIVAKLRRSRYEPGRRSTAWLKIKIRPEQELVVGGWTPGEDNARDLGALAVGVYEDGALRFAGKVGLRVHGRDPRALLERLAPLTEDAPAVRPAATEGLSWPLGRRPRRRHLGAAGARHPRRARRLVARRHGPPGRVQGRRGRAGPADRDPRTAGRHRGGGPGGRSGCAPGHGP